MKKIIAILLCACVLLAGCRAQSAPIEPDTDATNGESTGTTSAPAQTDFSAAEEDMFTDRDTRADYDEGSCVLISLNGQRVSASSDAVKIKGTTATLTEEASYIVRGSLSDGMLVVDAPYTAKVQIVLDGVDMTSSSSAPIYIKEADKVFITLAPASENTLSNGGAFAAIDENNIDSVIFSKQDLTLNGEGSLTVSSPAGHGIVSKDDLVITGGEYNITCASHAAASNDSVRIKGATLTLDAGKDGIHAENSDDSTLGFVYIADGEFVINAQGDGISAGAHMQIEDGSFDITTGGGAENSTKQTSDSWGNMPGGFGGMGGGMPGGGMGGRREAAQYSTTSTETEEEGSTSIKGIKSSAGMLLSGGSYNINSADDSVHSNASVTVNGGSFEIASGDDAFHADEALTFTGGKVNITESYEGLEGLDITVSGGDITLVASDDGLNAAGGTDSSGFGGDRGGDMFGGRGGMGGFGGGMGASDGSILISGGTLDITASGDGIDANGTLEITGGHTTVCGPTMGDTATLDYDRSAVISGGTFIGTGASGMAQTFSGSEQGVIAVSVGNQVAGTQIVLKDADGNTVFTYSPPLSFAVVIVSSTDLVSGQTYEMQVGTVNGDVQAN